MKNVDCAVSLLLESVSECGLVLAPAHNSILAVYSRNVLAHKFSSQRETARSLARM